MFNEVMGVGKTPQVTKDIESSPYSIPDDASYLIFGHSLIQETGINGVEAGSLFNVLNANYDYEGTDPYQIYDAAGSAWKVSKILDLGKALYIRGLQMYFESDTLFTFYTSVDGSTWTQIYFAPSGNFPNFGLTNLRLRYLKITVESLTGTSQFVLRRIKLLIDATQNFYK